jgi:hypothetical protein
MDKTHTTKTNTRSSSHSVSARSLDSTFTCSRCQGLFVQEFCMDMYDDFCHHGFWALRCLQCGELLYPLILQHRIPTP